jgi:hypothetical protein
MARISTYNLDDRIDPQDRVLGSSYEGVVNGNAVYVTKNYRLSDLATFFQSYDPDLDTSISQLNTDVNDLDSRVTTLETAGTDLTSFSVTTNAAGAAGLIYNNTNGVFTYTPPDLSTYLTSVAFADLTSTPTTIAGYGITDAFDGAYSSLSGIPTSFPPDSHNHDTLYAPLSHNHDDRYYTETEVDTLLNGYLSTSANLGDLANVSSATPSSGQVLKWTGTEWAPGTDLQASGGTGISLTDLSVSVATAGTANLAYNNTNGTFTYTPPDLTTYVSLTGLSAVNSGTASGGGSLAYNNTSGAFTYTPPDLSSYITLSSLSVNTNPVGTAALSYSSSTGIFNYTPPDLSGYLQLTGGTLTGDLTLATGADLILQGGDIAVTGNITASSVASPILVGDVYSNGPSSTIVLENGSGGTPNAYFIGDLATGSGAANLVFDTSTTTFRKNLNIGDVATENLNLTLGETSKIYFADGQGPEHATDPYTFINATSTSNWDAAYGSYVRDLGFYLSDNVNRRFGISITGDDSGNYDRNITDVIAEGSYLSFSANTNGMLTMGVDTNSNPANGDLGVATVSYVNNKFASDATAIGWNIGTTVTAPDSVNIVLYAEDGLSFVYTPDDTNNPNGYDDFSIRNSKGVESFAINDNTGVLTITKTSAGGAPGTLTANLETYVDSRVSAGATPSLQQVTNNDEPGDTNNVTTNDIGIGNVTTPSRPFHIRKADVKNLVLIENSSTANGAEIEIKDAASSNPSLFVGVKNSVANFTTSTSGTQASSTMGLTMNLSSGNISIGAEPRVNDKLYVNGNITTENAISAGGNLSSTADISGVNLSLTGTISASGYNDSNWNTAYSKHLTSAPTFNTASGVITFSTQDASNFTVDLDGRYAETANSNTFASSNIFNGDLDINAKVQIDEYHKIYFNSDSNGSSQGSSDYSIEVQDNSSASKFSVNKISGAVVSASTFTGTNFVLSSDERLKENINDLKPRKINASFKEYNFKEKRQTRFGVIAQELEKHHPEFIRETDHGYKSVAYIDLLVAKIVELEDRLKQLEDGPST